MQTITTTDLDTALARYTREAHALQLLPEGYRVALETGSKTYGNQFRLSLVKPDGSWSAARCPAGDPRLGFTRREAWEALHRMADTMRDVREAQREAAPATPSPVYSVQVPERPTFYLDPNVQGITSPEGAAKVAALVVGAPVTPGQVFMLTDGLAR